MANVPSIPALKFATIEEIAAEIEKLRSIAADAGLGTLSYLLEMALMEAKGQVALAKREAEARKASPNGLWRPSDK